MFMVKQTNYNKVKLYGENIVIFSQNTVDYFSVYLHAFFYNVFQNSLY